MQLAVTTVVVRAHASHPSLGQFVIEGMPFHGYLRIFLLYFSTTVSNDFVFGNAGEKGLGEAGRNSH